MYWDSGTALSKFYSILSHLGRIKYSYFMFHPTESPPFVLLIIEVPKSTTFAVPINRIHHYNLYNNLSFFMHGNNFHASNS
jgi:hypothetical protein